MCSGPVTDSLAAGIVLQINWLLQQHFSKYIRDIRQPRAGVKCAGLENINIKQENNHLDYGILGFFF